MRAFGTPPAFEEWMAANHAGEPGIWVKLAKKNTGVSTIDYDQALEVALCFGWIDSKGQRIDDTYFGVRFQPRKPKSNWSARNVGIVERLLADGRMREPGLAQVEAAKTAGRWPS